MLIGPKCKYCRKFGQKLGLNERCLSNKCALSRRRTRPGSSGSKPKVLSLYSRQLLEKQKLKFSYLITERVLKNYVKLSKSFKKSSTEALMEILERRLDNVIWRAGYVPSKTTAKQLVSHGHFLINGKRIKSSSYLVKKGDLISIRPQSRDIKVFDNLSQRLKFYQPPQWLEVDQNSFEVKVKNLPNASEIQNQFNINLVIDFYSRQ